MKSLRVDSWEGLQAALFKGSWNETIGRYRSPFVFRGLPDAHFDLSTSLMRLGGDYAVLEKHLLRNFRKYGHESFGHQSSIWHCLAMAQHHGLPTRLLDWTYSPFVAMHFATADIDIADQDGVIWRVNYHDSAAHLPVAFKERLEHDGGNVFTADMLSGLVEHLDALDAFGPEPFFVFFEPPAIDARIVNQHALFSFTSSPALSMSNLLAGLECDKVIIPAELKWEIRDKLDQANITERVLFPGLEGLSEWLRRHYSPKGGRS